MSKPIILPAILSAVNSRVDRSYILKFSTRELGGDKAAELFAHLQDECWVLIAPTKDAIDQADVPNYKPDNMLTQKTPAQRLRATLFVLWSQRGKNGDFEDFYRSIYENIIDLYKSKLEDVEAIQ